MNFFTPMCNNTTTVSLYSSSKNTGITQICMEIHVKESCTDISKKFTIRVNNTNAKNLAVIVCVCTQCIGLEIPYNASKGCWQ